MYCTEFAIFKIIFLLRSKVCITSISQLLPLSYGVPQAFQCGSYHSLEKVCTCSAGAVTDVHKLKLWHCCFFMSVTQAVGKDEIPSFPFSLRALLICQRVLFLDVAS